MFYTTHISLTLHTKEASPSTFDQTFLRADVLQTGADIIQQSKISPKVSFHMTAKPKVYKREKYCVA